MFPFGPTLDGTFVTDDPEVSIANGRYYNVTMIVGFNKNEGMKCDVVPLSFSW